MAIEPLVRRLWPQLLVSWSRLLRGRLRDPLVGRDIFLGIVVGAFVILGMLCYCAASDTILVHDPAAFMEAKTRFGRSLIGVAESVRQSLGVLFIFVAIRSVTKSKWVAITTTALLCAASIQVMLMLPRYAIIAPVVIAASTIFLKSRLGFLFYASYLTTVNFLSVPYTTDTGAFYAEAGYAHLAVAALIAALSLSIGCRKDRAFAAWV